MLTFILWTWSKLKQFFSTELHTKEILDGPFNGRNYSVSTSNVALIHLVLFSAYALMVGSSPGTMPDRVGSQFMTMAPTHYGNTNNNRGFFLAECPKSGLLMDGLNPFQVILPDCSSIPVSFF